MKKLLSILLALVLATGLFAACSGSGSGSQAAGSTASGSGAAAAPTEEGGVGYHRAIRSPAFVLFFIAMMGAATLYAGFMTFATAFWQSCGMSATQSATNISFLSFFGALISMVSGVILEKFGSKVLMMLTFGGYIVGMVLVPLLSGLFG